MDPNERSFIPLALKPVYRSEEDSIANEFYLPALARTKTYRRAVGYFSSSALVDAAVGLAGLIRNKGRMQLVIGNPVSDDDWAAIQSGTRLESLAEELKKQLLEVLQSGRTAHEGYSFDLLSWMVATSSIEIKFALRKGGMYHEKIGILENDLGESIVFHGSANESSNAILPTKNLESIAVYPSWAPDIYESYALPFSQAFDRLWSNTAKNVQTIPVPSEFYGEIHKARASQPPPDVDLEQDLIRTLTIGATADRDRPHLPQFIGTQRYALRHHQEAALRAWVANDYRGIFALATGAGKTITVLHAATRFYEQQAPTFLVIAVPYIVLAEQWCNVMATFNMHPIQAWGGTDQWAGEATRRLTEFKVSSRRFASIVVVNDTLATSQFQDFLSGIPSEHLFFVADECHHHGTSAAERSIPKAARYIVGLSATPWNPGEDLRKKILTESYGDVCATYSLKDAMSDGVLCPYSYFINIVSIDDDEAEDYVLLSQQLGALQAQLRESSDPQVKLRLQATAGRRARLVGSFRKKYERLSTIVRERKQRISRTLFYAGEGQHPLDASHASDDRNIDKVTRILASMRINIARVTAAETNNERTRILLEFQRGTIDAIAAIRVLDEGFDIAGCRSAYLLASSNSQRQYIQRRGRVLRPDVTKTKAEIIDFIALPSPSQYFSSETVWRRYLTSEISRASEFFNMADNPSDVANLYSAVEQLEPLHVISSNGDDSGESIE
jgi:superfamily II DNA or RNA helicase